MTMTDERETSRVRFVARAEFGKRLRKLMSDKGISPADLAAACWGEHANQSAAGMAAIDFYCSGKVVPSSSMLTQFASILGVPETELMPQIAGKFGGDHSDVVLTVVAGQSDRVHISWNAAVSLDTAMQMLTIFQGDVRKGFTDP
jgi:transcriptional regulator with XRE-family HTH domain